MFIHATEETGSVCMHANTHEDCFSLHGGIISVIFTFDLCFLPLYFPNSLQEICIVSVIRGRNNYSASARYSDIYGEC